MAIYETIYKKGCLKLIGRPKIEGDVIKVRIVNRDNVLTEEDMEDILNSLKEKSEGKLLRFEEVFK